MADYDDSGSMPATPDEYLDREVSGSPASPGSVSSSEASTPLEAPLDKTSDEPKRVPSLRTVSDPQNMNPSSTPLGMLNTARRPPPTAASMMSGGSTNDIMARARALHAQRMSRPAGPQASASSISSSPGQTSPSTNLPGGIPGNLNLSGGGPALTRPSLGGTPRSAPPFLPNLRCEGNQ